MNDNTKRVKWLLGIGATLVYMAGLSILSSTIASDALKIIVNTLISVALISISVKVEDGFKLKGIGKYSFVLGLASFLMTFIYVGHQGLLGEYLSFDGKGSYLYITFIYLLVTLFAYITALRYKDYIAIYIEYLGLLMGIYSLMCHFSSNILANLSVMGILILFINSVKLNKNLNNFAKWAALVYAFITTMYIVGRQLDTVSMFIFSLIIIIVNAINIFVTMYKDKRFLPNIASIILFVMNTSLIVSTFGASFDRGICLLLTAIVYSVFEILLNYLNVIEENSVSVILKIIINVAYFDLFLSTDYILEYSILAAIIFGTSFINSYIYKNDKNEYVLLPLKLIFVVTALFRIVDANIISLNTAILYILLDLTFLGLISISKDHTHKVECTVLTLFYSYSLLFYNDLTPTLYVLSGLITLLNYYVVIIRNNDVTSFKGRLYYGLLLFMMMVSLDNFDITGSKYLIGSLVFGILTIISYNDRVAFAITLPALYYTLLMYFWEIDTITEAARSFIYTILNYSFVVTWIYRLKISDSTKNALYSLALIFLSLGSLTDAYVLNTLVTIVVAVIMIYLGIKYPKYRVLHGSGLFIVIISLLSLTSFLGEAKAFIYLLVVGGGIIYSVVRLASKGIPEELPQLKEEVENKEDIVELPKEVKKVKYDTSKVAFCYNCGNKLKGDEVFCGKCGTKLK